MFVGKFSLVKKNLPVGMVVFFCGWAFVRSVDLNHDLARLYVSGDYVTVYLFFCFCHLILPIFSRLDL